MCILWKYQYVYESRILDKTNRETTHYWIQIKYTWSYMWSRYSYKIKQNLIIIIESSYIKVKHKHGKSDKLTLDFSSFFLFKNRLKIALKSFDNCKMRQDSLNCYPKLQIERLFTNFYKVSLIQLWSV